MHNEVLEDLVVVKRSGQRVAFNASKVALAIKKAFDSVNPSDEKSSFKIFEKVLTHINDNYKERKTINVEDIQDIIENTLYNEKEYDVYNNFKDYREKRALSRKVFAEKQQHKFVKAIEKIEETNQDKDYSTSAENLIYDFGKIISSEYTKSYILDTKSSRLLEEGNIYIHDLDYFSLGVFPRIHLSLAKSCDNELIISKLITTVINAQHEVDSEIGLNNIDFLLNGYFISKFKQELINKLKGYFNILGFKEFICFKKIEEQILNESSININKSKYSNIIVNETVDKVFETSIKETAEYLNKFINSTLNRILYSIEDSNYSEGYYSISFGLNTSSIGKLINNNIIQIIRENEFNHIKIIYKVDNLEFEHATKLAEVIEKNKSIYLLLTNNNKLDYFANGSKIYTNINNNDSFSGGRMIVSSTSINLSRMGLKYQNKVRDKFYNELSNLCEMAKNELLLSFENIGNKSVDYYKALFKGNIFDDEKLETGQKIRKVIKNGTLNIGIIGLKECVTLLEKEPSKQLKLAESILDFINDKCKEYSIDTKINFGTFEPNDIASRKRLLSIDKSIYGEIKDITDKKMYDLIDLNFTKDYKVLAEFQKKFTFGKLITINIPSKLSMKKLADLIEELKSSGIEFAKLTTNKNDN